MYEKESKQIYHEQFCQFGFDSHSYQTNNPIGLWKNEAECLLWTCLNSHPDFNWLEVGSFCGGSSVLMCLARRFLNAGPSVYCVDIDFTKCNNAFNRNIYRIGEFQDICKKLEGTNKLITSDLGQLSFAFLDGWHSFKGVYTDFLAVDKLMVKGGHVAFHDCYPQPYPDGMIDKFYQIAVQGYKEWMKDEILQPHEVGEKISPAKYHETEQLQNFLIDEAIAYIINEHKYSYVKVPVLDSSETHLDRIPTGYTRGKTSPFQGLVVLKKE